MGLSIACPVRAIVQKVPPEPSPRVAHICSASQMLQRSPKRKQSGISAIPIQVTIKFTPRCLVSGISMAANKVPGIRCALCGDAFSAKMTRLHNDANVLSMGAGIVGENLALEIVETFLNTPFSGDARHQRRIDLIESV